jgi:uncharacterized membrane-anchored protein
MSRRFALAPARALDPSPIFWLAMLAASALGTNLGDFWSDALALGLTTSFVSLAAISAALVAGDRLWGLSTEAMFWFAIVILRAAATNVGDFVTDDLGVSRLVSSPVFGAATLAAGYFTLGRRSPDIDLRYWLAMFFGGVFGTVAGDFVSHAIGLPAATAGLAALLVVAIAAWSRAAAAPLLAYWGIVLLERAAGTPAGDLFAEDRGLGLGLPVAMSITGAAFVLALALRGRRVGAVRTPAPAR